MKNMDIAQLAAFILYLLIVLAIGIIFYCRTRGGGSKEYFLGGRKMNGWVTALSANASDMSAWALMGFPGSIFAFGMGKVWIAIGLFIGSTLSWIFMAKRLRLFSKACGDSITLPEYLSNRFLTKSKTLRIVCAIVFFVCYIVYAASSFKACGIVFNRILGLDIEIASLIGTAIILVYTFLGGFAAVCWTDFFQGMLILVALLIAPIFAYLSIGGGEAFGVAMTASATGANYWNLLPSGKFDWASISSILSGLGWAFGYFGMPHILVRFMSIRKPRELKQARVIAIVWQALVLIAAIAVGLVGVVFLPELIGGNGELVFINMVQRLFPGFIAGLLLSGILAASMSTADSQLLVAASSVVHDVYKPVVRKKASDKEMMWVSRIAVVVITIIAYFIAINPGAGSVMSLVENAWAGFASAFAPALMLSLFWKRFTYRGAIWGIIVGAVVDVVWLAFLSGPTGLYEIFPGVICGLIAAIVATLLDKKPAIEVQELFDKAVSGEGDIEDETLEAAAN